MFSSRQTTPVSLRRRSGFTIVECAVSVVIVGVMLVAAFSVVAGAAKSRRLQFEIRAREALARALVSEVQQAAYSGDPASPIGIRINLLGLIRVQLGGSTQTGASGRLGFDDIDDYKDYSENSPTERDGTPIAGFTGWRRRVNVDMVDPADPAGAVSATDRGLKRITVIITAPSGKATSLVSLRSAWSSFQNEDSGVVTGVDARITADGRTLRFSSALPNTPPQ